jgi:hypothetical protein
MKLSKNWISGAVILCIGSSSITNAREAFKLVRIKGDFAANTAGAQFFNFSTAIINDNDELAYRGVLQTGAGVTSASNDGIWTDDCDTPNNHFIVGREGTNAPGTGSNFTGIVNTSNFQINNSDVVALRAQLTGAGVTTANDFGIWTTAPGPLTLVAREGDVAPGTGGAIFRTIGLPAQSDNASSDIYFKAELVNDGVTATIFNDTAIFGYVGGSLTLIHREGDTTPVLPVGAGGPATTATYGQFLLEVTVSENGRLIFSSNINGVPSNLNSALFTRFLGTTAVIIQEDTPMPDALGVPTAALISSFVTFGINDTGQIILRAGLRPGVGGVVNSNNEAILTTTGGFFRLLAREGDPTPEGGNTFAIFRNVFVGDSGATCFQSGLNGNVDAIYSGCWHRQHLRQSKPPCHEPWRPGSLHLITCTGWRNNTFNQRGSVAHIRSGHSTHT